MPLRHRKASRHCERSRLVIPMTSPRSLIAVARLSRCFPALQLEELEGQLASCRNLSLEDVLGHPKGAALDRSAEAGLSFPAVTNVCSQDLAPCGCLTTPREERIRQWRTGPQSRSCCLP